MGKLDVYNENKEKTGKIVERKVNQKFTDNEYYLYVQCWIINRKGEILLTQRNSKKLHGGYWEPTGGCVLAGETSDDAVIRELKEELGLSINKENLKHIKTLKQNRKERNCFREIYLLEKNIKLNDIKYSDGEVVDAKFVTLQEMEKLLKENKMVSWLEFFIKEYKKYIEKEN